MSNNNNKTNNTTTTFTQEDAIKVLIQSVNVAQQRGTYNLAEAATIHKAVSVFLTKQQGTTEQGTTEQRTEEAEEKKNENDTTENSVDVTKTI